MIPNVVFGVVTPPHLDARPEMPVSTILINAAPIYVIVRRVS
jgi:hypothetical protein